MAFFETYREIQMYDTWYVAASRFDNATYSKLFWRV